MSGFWTLLRRPLFLLFAMGLLLSLESTGRLSVRVVADGMVSFAFLPLCELLSIGVVYLRGDRRLWFAAGVDAFFATNAPWLFWILGYCLLRVTRTPLQASGPPSLLVYATGATMLVPICWSAYLDWRFFHVVLPRTNGSPFADFLTQRAIAWTCALGYFFGIVGWAQLVEWLR